MICWGATSDECEATSFRLIEQAEQFLGHARHATARSVRRSTRWRPLPDAVRVAEAARLAPVVRGLASTDRPLVGHFSDAPVVLEFLASDAAPRLAALGTSCPDHFLRTKVRPLFLDLGPGDAVRCAGRTPPRAAPRVPRGVRGLLRSVTRRPTRRRCAAPIRSIVLVPGVGMWSFGLDAPSARVAGEFFVNAINVMRGAESVSSYTPIPDAEKFRVEYWELEERKLQMRPAPPLLAGRVAFVTGGASGIGRAIAERLAARGRERRRRRPRRRAGRRRSPPRSAPSARWRSRSTSATRPRSPRRSPTPRSGSAAWISS